MLQYQDVWTGSGYRRQIQGCTLQIVLQPTDSQHSTAALQLHNYCSFFGQDGPVVIGRGCHNIWRPYGSASRGTKALAALEVFSLDKPRETFISIFSRDPKNRQYLPGEVVVYGQGEMAVCLDSSETAIPLVVYSVSDPVMVDFPAHVAGGILGNKHLGFNLCNPIYALVGVLGQWTQMRMDVAQLMNNPAHYQWCMQLEGRLRLLEEDINDYRLLCYSQAKLDGVKVSVDNDALAVARRNGRREGTCNESFRGDWIIRTPSSTTTTTQHSGTNSMVSSTEQNVLDSFVKNNYIFIIHLMLNLKLRHCLTKTLMR
jgi:hypothetical protein